MQQEPQGAESETETSAVWNEQTDRQVIEAISWPANIRVHALKASARFIESGRFTVIDSSPEPAKGNLTTSRTMRIAFLARWDLPRPCLVSAPMATKSSKENKGDSLKPPELPSLDTINTQWTKLKMTVKGDTGTLTIRAWQTELKHAALQREKKETTMSFAFGQLAIRKVKLLTPN